jgi:hypothetical protein
MVTLSFVWNQSSGRAGWAGSKTGKTVFDQFFLKKNSPNPHQELGPGGIIEPTTWHHRHLPGATSGGFNGVWCVVTVHTAAVTHLDSSGCCLPQGQQANDHGVMDGQI